MKYFLKKQIQYLGWIPITFLVWLFIFGTYEIIERTLLKSTDISTLHILHIIRGTGTSFILAGLVAWYLIRHRGIIEKETLLSSGLIESRYLDKQIELHNKMQWLVKLRWIAISGVLIAILITKIIPVISNFSAIALLLIAFVMCIYNIGFYILLSRTQATKAVAFSQVFLDLISLTLLLHFSGGIENPFFAFFIFHVIIASILLEKNESYIISTITCILFSSMVILEHIGILKHYPLFSLKYIFSEWYYIAGILVAFISTAMFSTYFTTTIMDSLREKQKQLVHEINRIKEMQAQLVQAGKMVAVGELASSIAHEINNPLATIGASSEFLQDFVKEDKFKKYLKRIEDNVYRCKEIIQSLLGFARREDTGLNESNVNEILTETLKLVKESASDSSKEIIVEYGEDAPFVHANFRQLQQVFLNLIINALDAIETNGTVRIKTLQNNGYVIVEVLDNGKGIPQEHIYRIFEPFFTTKPDGRGTGLGLYLAHQIISSMNGKIEVKSELRAPNKVGGGTTFSVSIPIKK